MLHYPATAPADAIDPDREAPAEPFLARYLARIGYAGPVAPTFEVTLDTHSIDLDGYDLAELASLRTDDGELQPERWNAPEGGHHRSGTLLFPPTESRALELVIRAVGDVPERTFRWTR